MDIDGCDLPEDRVYDLDAEVWAKSDGRAVTVGLMASLVARTGKVHSVTYRPIEGTARRGQSVATIEAPRLTFPVRLPVGGTIVERNAELRRRPKLLNDAPYGAGWIVRLSPSDPAEVDRNLAPAAAIAPALGERIRRLRIRCYPAYPDAELYEIGAECRAVLARLDEELARRAPGEVVLLLTDDPTSPIEMVRWSDRSGHRVLHHRVEQTIHHFLVQREGARPPSEEKA